MNKKAVLLWIIAFIFLVACGGGGETEPDTPASDNNTSSSTTTETTESEEDSSSADSEQPAEEPEESEPTDEAESMEEETDAEPASEEPAEEPAAASPFGDRPLTGTDPETGLPVNPESVSPGDTFVVRGEIISMNLTPTTSPEFLIQSPDGFNYRLRSQDLADTYFEDGDQLQAFQYKNGLLAQATATLATDASPSDIPISDDLVLIKEE